MSLFSKLGSLSKKWLIAVIALTITVVAGATAVVVMAVGKKGKNQVVDSFELVLGEQAVVEYYMGDTIDVSDIKIVGTKNGVSYLKNVSFDMLELPSAGVGENSGLNKNGMFLAAGEKTITIVDGENRFDYAVSVQEDAVVSITIEAGTKLSVYENANAKQALDGVNIYSRRKSGRNVQVSLDDIEIISAISDGDENILDENGIIRKTNSTIYAQQFSLLFRYKFIYGENLPIEASTEDISETIAASVVDKKMKSIDVLFDDSAVVYQSVATNTDLIDVLPLNSYSVFEDNERAEVFFSDGEFLFEFVELANGKRAYVFKTDENGDALTFDGHSRVAYVAYWSIGGQNGSLFMPFGETYSIVDGVPSSAIEVGVVGGKKAFVPADTNVFLAAGDESISVEARVEYTTRSGEGYVAWVFDAASPLSVDDIDVDADSVSENELQSAMDFYFVVDKTDKKHYVTAVSFGAAFSGSDFLSKTIFFNNFGFAEEELVLEENGYYYHENGNLVEVANITRATGYFYEGQLVGFVVNMPSLVNMKSIADETPSTIFIADEVSVSVVKYVVENNWGFVVKASKATNILCDAGHDYLVCENKAVSIEVLTETENRPSRKVGTLISLDGYSLAVVLEKGDRVVLGDNGKYLYFGEERSWSDNDFVFFGSGWTKSEAEQVFAADISTKPYYTTSGNNAECLCVYVGELGNAAFGLNTFVSFDVEADPVESITFASSSFVVSGGDNFERDLLDVIYKNILSIEFESHLVWDKTLNEDICGIVFSNASDIKKQYGDPRSFNGDDFAVCLIVSLPNVIVDGENDVDIYFWDGNSTAFAKTIRIVRTTNDTLFSDIVVAGTQIVADGISFAASVDVLDDVEVSLIPENDQLDVVVVDFETLRTSSMFDILGNAFGGYVIESETNDLCVSFEYVENYISSASIVKKAEGYSVDLSQGNVPNMLWADGSDIDVENMLAYDLWVGVASASLGTQRLGTASDYAEYLTAKTKAPITKSLGMLVAFEFEDGNNDVFAFSAALDFYENATATFDKMSDFATAFASESGLEKNVEQGSFGIYRRDGSFDEFVSVLDENTLISSTTNNIYARAGVSFAMQDIYGMRNVYVDKDANGHFVLVGDRKCYVEEDFVFVVQNGGPTRYSRIVIDLNGTKNVLYVAINDAFDDEAPESESNRKYLGILANQSNLSIKISDENGDVIWEGTYQASLSGRIESLSREKVGGEYKYSKIYVTAYGDFYGVGDSTWVDTLASDSVELEFFDVPTVTGGGVSENTLLVERQVLSIGDLATISKTYDNVEYETVFAFPALEIFYDANNNSGSYAAGSYLLKDLVFVEKSSHTYGEIGYSVYDGGKTIVLGDWTDSEEVSIDMKYLGMKFTVTIPVTRDFVVSANYGRRSMIEGSLLTDNSLRLSPGNCVMASGRKMGTLSSDDNGKIGSVYETFVVVKKGNNKWLLKTDELYLVFGPEYETVADAGRLFSYSDNYTFTSYALVIEPSNVEYDQNSALFAAVFGNWMGTGFGKGTALSSAKLDLAQDRLESVELSNVRTEYVTDIASIGFYDYFSFGDARFEFESGIEFVCPANNVNYLVARDGDIEVVSQLENNDIVLRKFELSFGKEKRSTGNVAVMQSTLNGQNVDASLLSFAQPVQADLVVTFTAGGISSNESIEICYVEPQIEGIAVIFGEHASIGIGTSLSKEDIIGYVASARIVCLNMNDIYLTPDQMRLIYIQPDVAHGENKHYYVQNGGNSIYVASRDFELADLVFGFDVPEDEASADQIAELSFEFELDENDNYVVKRFIGDAVDVVVPEVYRGASVVAIGENAFNNENGHAVVSVELPDSVTNIGNNAFYDCEMLETINLDGVERFGQGSFEYCSSLTSLVFGDVEIFNSFAFGCCNSLESVSFGNVEEFSVQAFSYCPALSNVVFNGGVGTLGNGLFAYCGALSSISIPDGVLVIPQYAFESCTALENVYIPSSVANIGANAFQNCTSLESITIPASVETTIAAVAFGGCTALANVTIDGTNSAYARKVCDGLRLSNYAGIVWVDASVWANVYDYVETKKQQGENYRFSVKANDSGENLDRLFDFALNSTETGYVITNYKGSDVIVKIPALYSSLPVVEIGYNAFSGKGVVRVDASSTALRKIGNSSFSSCNSLKSIEISVSVASIGEGAFYGCSSLTSIEIPAGVTAINNNAFQSCTSLSSIEIPESVTTIGQRAFESCSSLESVIFEENSQLLTIGQFAFAYCASFASVTIPAGVTSIGSHAFASCTSLASIEIPSSVTTIGAAAFSSCTNLISITIPFGVTSIGGSAFTGCTNLASITIPASVTLLGLGAFINCTSLTSISVAAENSVYDSRNNCNAIIKTATNALIGGCKNTTIPATVAAIDSYAFDGCTGLKNITIPASVLTIGYSSFFMCTNLESVSFAPGSQLTFIDYDAFSGCSSLSSIEIPASVTTVRERVFASCSSLESVIFEDNSQLEIINDSTFSGCTSLSSIEIPESVTTISSNAFRGCSSLASIVLTAQTADRLRTQCWQIFNLGLGSGSTAVKFDGTVYVYVDTPIFNSVRSYVADTCNDQFVLVNTKEAPDFVMTANDGGWTVAQYIGNGGVVQIPATYSGSQVTKISDYAFYNNTDVTKVIIPASIVEIAGTSNTTGAFSGCTSLESVEFEEQSNLSVIGSQCFWGCSALEEIAIPASVTTIGENAFRGCTSLANVEFEEGSQLSSIGTATFMYCRSLASIEIPAGITAIQSAFASCNSLESVTFAEGSHITTIGTYAFSSCTSLSSIEIPVGVTTIDYDAFNGCTSLANITIPSTVTIIGSQAFNGCTALESITIPAGVASISQTFYGCSSLESVTFAAGSHLLTIGIYAFSGCTSLSSIEIPASVTSIGKNAFKNCTSLEEITIPAGVGVVSESLFEGCTNLANVEFAGTNILSVSDSAFRGCSAIETIDLPEGVTEIGEYAFWGCTSLNRIGLPSTLEAIADGAFNGCDEIKEIVLPAAFEQCGSNVFYGCNAIEKVVLFGTEYEELFDSLGGVDYAESVYVDSTILSEARQYLVDEGYLFGVLSLDNYESDKAAEEFFTFEYDSIAGGYVITSARANATATRSVVNTLCSVPATYRGTTIVGIATNAIDDDAMVVFDARGTSITSIAAFAFTSADSLEQILLPTTLTSVGNSAFQGAGSALNYVEYLGNNQQVVSGLCSALSQIDFGGTIGALVGMYETIVSFGFDCVPVWSDEDVADVFTFNQISNGDAWEISGYSGTFAKLYLPTEYDGKPITSIAIRAFANHSELTNIVIPEGYVYLGSLLFYQSNNLVSVKIPASAVTIESSALSYCQIITYIDINENNPVYFSKDSGGTYNAVIKREGMVLVSGSLNTTFPTGLLSIGGSAFAGRAITSISIPQGVTRIENNAFCECRSLQSVTISNSVAFIDYRAFAYTRISDVIIPANVEFLGVYIFSGCGLQTIHIETNNVNIAKDYCSNISSSSFNGTIYVRCADIFEEFKAFVQANYYFTVAFEWTDAEVARNFTMNYVSGTDSYEIGALLNSNITKISLPSVYGNKSVSAIGQDAFAGCSNITSVTIPASVTSIASGAFAGCTALEDITIPASVTNIGSEVFAGCSSLASISVAAQNSVFDSRNGCNAIIRTADNTLVVGCENTTIPASVVAIAANAFSGCAGLASIIIPASVTTIGSGAFAGCTGLATIYIETASLLVAQGYCSVFESAGFSGVVYVYNNDVYDGLAEYVEQQGYGFSVAFEWTDAEIARNFTMNYLSGTDSYEIGALLNSTITNIELPAQYNGKAVTVIGTGAFYELTYIKTVVIPASITTIGQGAFSSCSSLTGITIPSSVATIDTYAFYNCTNLTRVDYTDTIAKWCEIDFANDNSNPLGYAHHLYIGGNEVTTISAADLNGVTEIKQYAFYGCTGLSSISIPSGVTSVGEGAFNGCRNLSYSTYGNAKYLGNSDNLYLVLCAPTRNNITSCTIHSDAVVIADSAFYGCASLTSIVIPQKVINIGNDAFAECDSLASLTFDINSSLVNIGNNAFSGCGSLQIVNIPQRVITIGHNAFAGGRALAKVTISACVETIGEFAFISCSPSVIVIDSAYVYESITDRFGAGFLIADADAATQIYVLKSVVDAGVNSYLNGSEFTRTNGTGTMSNYYLFTKN